MVTANVPLGHQHLYETEGENSTAYGKFCYCGNYKHNWEQKWNAPELWQDDQCQKHVSICQAMIKFSKSL